MIGTCHQKKQKCLLSICCGNKDRLPKVLVIIMTVRNRLIVGSAWLARDKSIAFGFLRAMAGGTGCQDGGGEVLTPCTQRLSPICHCGPPFAALVDGSS